MIGEFLGESIGQITGTRVVPTADGGTRLEISFQDNGTLLGLHTTEMATYESVPRPDGTMFGQGQGVVLTENGDTLTWKGQGAGRLVGRGTATSWRGAIYYQTTSERLARLNGVAVVFEYDVDETGKTEAKLWEWK
jgi:hypothetical protein